MRLYAKPCPFSNSLPTLNHVHGESMAITTEDPDEAVQSSDPFTSIIHCAQGDRNAGLLFSERPRNPIYSREQRKCHAVVEWITKTATEWRRRKTGSGSKSWGCGLFHRKSGEPSNILKWNGKEEKKSPHMKRDVSLWVIEPFSSRWTQQTDPRQYYPVRKYSDLATAVRRKHLVETLCEWQPELASCHR